MNMTNVSKTEEKKRVRRALVNAALATLEKQGWKAARVKGGGMGRVRRITKNGKSQLAVIRTSQDQYLAFPRTDDDSAWTTLSEVDVVVASVVDDRRKPQVALVHIFDAKEMRDRFDRAYAARQKAEYSIPVGRGLWLSLYDEEGTSPTRVGAGAGIVHPPIARVPLGEAASNGTRPPVAPPTVSSASDGDDSFEPLTIPQAKARLARTLGVDPDAIKITVEA
jgi:hypothetical protein